MNSDERSMPNRNPASTRPAGLPAGYPATADELDALVRRGRRLRARAVHALWLRLLRTARHTLHRQLPWRAGRPGAPWLPGHPAGT